MKFNSKEQEKAYTSAMNRKFKAAAFDVDGTLTHFAKPIIPHDLVQGLSNMPIKMPLIICTGRNLKNIHGKIKHICDAAPNSSEQKKRWYIVCENGGAGYEFNSKTNDYKQIFQVEWPEKVITKDTLEAFVKDKLGWHVSVVIRDHSIVVYFPKIMYFFPSLIRKISARTARQLYSLVKKMKIQDEIMIRDSGIGVILIPKNSGKGKAIKRLAQHLEIPLKDIMVLGDQPRPGENDEEMLSGDYGTPFTVGSDTKNTFPLPVFDETGRKITGPAATLRLIGSVEYS